jgi:hypothetical protein
LLDYQEEHVDIQVTIDDSKGVRAVNEKDLSAFVNASWRRVS